VGGDECGIIVAALYSNKQAYVIEDASDHYDPATYSKKIADLYHQYDAAAIVVETNAGGNAILYALRSVNANMKIIGVHTHQGKTTRAEHIASLYSQGKVHHTKIFKELEDQMCSFSIDYLHSPDRLDSLSYALTELFFPTAPASSLSFHNLPTR
jgi:predicted phage terminase large subunit-like protein